MKTKIKKETFTQTEKKTYSDLAKGKIKNDDGAKLGSRMWIVYDREETIINNTITIQKELDISSLTLSDCVIIGSILVFLLE